MRRTLLSTLALGLCLGLPGVARAEPVATVEARGNVLTGGLAFAPASVTAAVGDDVAWVNKDVFAPHTVRERHGLWELGGTYGATPLNPPGFAPGATVERTFEAGTHEYLCTVHPDAMKGEVAVPVVLKAERRRIRRAPTRRDRRRSRSVSYVTARWSSDPGEAQAFDAQRRRPGGRWVALAEASTEATGRFRTTPGTTWEVRARLRPADPAAAGTTSWSPVATITA